MVDRLTLNLPSVHILTDEQFFEICSKNRDLQFEKTADGVLIIMSPTGGETGRRNVSILFQLETWSQKDKTGVTFDSSTCFKLPNGANRSPDASWIQRQRWEKLTPAAREQFPPISPDFVIELRSKTDSLTTLQNKMKEYQQNGVTLGWLIDPIQKQVEIYRLNQPIEILQNPDQLSGEDILKDFILELNPIFNLNN
ncbi:Uma2 family endonuclease [Planktothrix mougeotii]|uniref:Uma2 family endonuclease n=1 Tax=Planktothrix mougeotii LEGE 06226 TaxID=1828728 RepID=A0ABR9UH15_9CYAN|nr:Uma2 family endonuclease [Planktothrix mougeotii]MBE9145762.1 Uma2 family endonuclease [Planktothrix mougeotii LEGE 06226]